MRKYFSKIVGLISVIELLSDPRYLRSLKHLNFEAGFVKFKIPF